MNESLLQYLWKNSLFSPLNLRTTAGDDMQVLDTGRLNHNAGPDFLNARIRIGPTIWAGNIELHVKSSDWFKHNHVNDPVYQSIILHVVYEEDELISDAGFPTLVLKPHLDELIVERYRTLMSEPQRIPCAGRLTEVPELIREAWMERMLAERWEQRLEEWTLLWEQSGKDWRTLLYYRLAANFGFHVNRDAFLELALSIPLNILVRHRNSLQKTEAMLFGQAGLLPQRHQDEYSETLEKEYHFLRRKYQLTPLLPYRWKFLRLRPSNFPTIRIAQFAMLVHTSLELFARMMEIHNWDELYPLMDLAAGSYWDNHYRFAEPTSEVQPKRIGQEAIANIMINTVAPMQYLYARLQGKTELMEVSLSLLQSLKPEKNKITRVWNDIGVYASDAARSQSLLQLYNSYCMPRACLNCAIGNRLLRR
jgi:hypothetical protein